MAELQAGRTFAGFQVEALIDRGGMSVVYRAHEVALGRTVALKVMDRELSADPAVRDRFVNEARRASAIDHPNILPIYTFGDDDGQLFIAMRYVEGGRDLGKIIEQRGRLRPDETMPLLAQAARALDRVHAAGLVHRDVKPENLLVAETADLATAHVYLSDFGLVQLTTSTQRSAASFAGTLAYAAPEQIRDEAVDLRADVYGLGAVLFRCLTGALPFVADDEAALMYAQLHSPPATVAATDPALAPIDDVIAVALAKEPGERFASCGELVQAGADALEPMLGDDALTRVRLRPADVGGVDSSASTVVKERPAVAAPVGGDGGGTDRDRRSRPWWIALAAVAVVAVVAAGLAFRPKPADPDSGAVPPVAGGILTVAAPNQSGWNPTHDLWSVSDRAVVSAVFDPLVVAGPAGYQPYLATSVESADSTTWTIGLPSGVRFHDGTPFDADAVKVDLDAAKHDPLVGQLMTSVVSVTVVDPLRVDVQLAGPWPSFPSLLAGQVGYMAAPSMLHGDGTTPIGTGPFVYDQSSKDVKVVLNRNASYWQPGRPRLDQVVVRPHDDAGVSLDDVQADAVNAALVPRTSLDDSRPGNFVETTVGLETATVVFNTATGPTDLSDIRTALGAATDRSALVGALGGDPVSAVSGPIGTAAPWPPNDEGYVAYDPARAQELIGSYRADNGKELTLNVLTAGALAKTALPLLTMWTAAGAKVNPKTDSQKDVLASASSGSAPAVSILNVEVPVDPSGLPPLFSSPVLTPSLNLARWAASATGDPAAGGSAADGSAANLFSQAQASADALHRSDLYGSAMRQINAALPYLWLYRDPVVLVAYHGVSHLGDADAGRPVFTELGRRVTTERWTGQIIVGARAGTMTAVGGSSSAY